MQVQLMSSSSALTMSSTYVSIVILTIFQGNMCVLPVTALGKGNHLQWTSKFFVSFKHIINLYLILQTVWNVLAKTWIWYNLRRQSQFSTHHFVTQSFMRRTSIMTQTTDISRDNHFFNIEEKGQGHGNLSTVAFNLPPWVEGSHLWFSENVELLYTI